MLEQWPCRTLRPPPPTLQIRDAMVDGTGKQLGCVAQNGEPLPGWDAGVERRGATAANDAARTEPLPLGLGLIGPSDVPDPTPRP